MPGALRTLLCAVLVTALASSISAQFRLFGPRSPKPAQQPKMRGASAYISRQEPLKVNQSVLKQAKPGTAHLKVISQFSKKIRIIVPVYMVTSLTGRVGSFAPG